jgi:hypothetical protein
MCTRKSLLYERTREFFSDICNLKISQVTLCTLLKVFVQRAQPRFDCSKRRKDKVVGGDETGSKVNRKSDGSGLLKVKLPFT